VFKFITHRPFWVNLLVAIGLMLLILFGILQMLGLITKHGEYLTVPSVTNKNTAEAIKLLESKGFDVTILDSVYVDTAKMGTVLKQFPEANSTVKVNRTVLLTVNRVTLPMVEMPSLTGKSLNYALEILKRSHLKLGDTTFKPDFMMGSVLEQKFKGGTIESGAKILWGSRIDLVIGAGLADQSIPVPDLEGKTYCEAKQILEELGISQGALIVQGNVKDTCSAFIIKQSPMRLTEDENKQLNYIQSGQVMDLWVSPVMLNPKDSSDNKNPE
jgi:beta-lactam-binding protein with PASTA domain